MFTEYSQMFTFRVMSIMSTSRSTILKSFYRTIQCKKSCNYHVLARGRMVVSHDGNHQSIARSAARPMSSTQDIKDLMKTPLYDFHIKHDARMVDFCGWSMPVQYKLGIIPSHLHTREKASLFDVSHMLQFNIHGKDRIKCLEGLVVADIEGMPEGSSGLSLFTNPNGGIRDDCIINKLEDHIYVVSNACCADKIKPLVMDHIEQVKNEMDVYVEFLDEKALLALQGPMAPRILQTGLEIDLSSLKFMNGITTSLFGVPDCRITRCGYTGEDGFELSIPDDKAVHLSEMLLGVEEGTVELAGLGSRDSLRLEAGLCLYGNDIDEETTPVEGVLVWTIGKRRRKLKDFPGADIILQQIKEKPRQKRVGIISKGPPARAGTQIMDQDGNIVGKIVSGCPSPSLKRNIAMAYVPFSLATIGQHFKLKVYKKELDAEIVKMPFVPTKYFM